MECLTCAFFDDLWGIKTAFNYRLYWATAPYMTGIVGSAMTIWLMVSSAKAWQKGDLEGHVKALFIRLIMVAAISTVMLYDGGPVVAGYPVPLVYSEIINPIETLALEYGSYILGHGDADVNQARGNGYSMLGGLVESQIYAVVKLVGQLIASASWLGGTIVERAIGGLLILLPYLFVWGIFVAFMLEAMFKFVAAGIISPWALPAVLLEPTRSFSWATLRILVGAFLTLVFAAGALSFTIAVTDKHGASIAYRINVQGAITEIDERYRNECKEMSADGSRATGGMRVDGRCGEMLRQKAELQDTQADLGWFLFSREFSMMFVIGFASILLHIQAKSLASNISGANDGAGPAAAVVAAGKGALAWGAMTSGRGAFGQGGLGTSMNQAFNSNPVTGALAQHGLVGGPVAGSAQVLRSVFPSMREAPAGGGNPFSDVQRGSGGFFSTGGGQDRQLTETLQSLSKAIENMGGGGRTRTP